MKNVLFTLLSNLASMTVTTLITLFAPRFLSVTEYSWLQLYMFYVGYIAVFTFGWGEGIYLRYGGRDYEDLEPPVFSGQYRGYMLLAVSIGFCILFVSNAFSDEYRFIVIALGIANVLFAPCLFYRNILICVNRIREYALSHIIEKSVYAIATCVVLLLFRGNYRLLVVSDLFGKSVASVFLILQCKRIICSRIVSIADITREAKENIFVGAKLLLSHLIGLLVIGIVRFSIERCWSVEVFGKVSLTMSVSNLLMVFIRAVALVMFPMLRRTNSDKLAGIYNTMRTCLMIPLLGMLVFYYPIKVILSAWLPAYADSLKYMALLFPMCVFESKTSMLIETYMKTLRKEKTLLFVNVATVCLSVLLTGITVYGMHNLDLAIVSIVVLLAFRCVIAELLLSRSMEIQVKKDIVLELTLTVIFICASWFIGGLSGLAIYAAAYLVYLFVKRHDLVMLLGFVKKKVLAKG